MILVVLLALMFFGPKRLPDLGRQIGRAIAEVRRVSREFEREVRAASEPFERELRTTYWPVVDEACSVGRHIDGDVAAESDGNDPPATTLSSHEPRA